MHYSLNKERHSMNKMNKVEDVKMKFVFTNIYRPMKPCLSMLRIDSNGILEGIAIICLVDGTIQFLRLCGSGVECLYSVDPENSPKKEYGVTKVGMHTMSCSQTFVNTRKTCKIDILLAGVTIDGHCAVRSVQISAPYNLDVDHKSTSYYVKILSDERLYCSESATNCCVGERYIAVGTSSGNVELFCITEIMNGCENSVVTLSTSEWGYDIERTGGVLSLSWTPSVLGTSESSYQSVQQSLAVGTRRGLVIIWSSSGCRLAMFHAAGTSKDYDVSVTGCCWCGNGMSLFICAPAGKDIDDNITIGEKNVALRNSCVLELNFAKYTNDIEYCSPEASEAFVISNTDEDFFTNIFLGSDRLILTGTKTSGPSHSDLEALHHICVPNSYLQPNRPLSTFSISDDGNDIALSGTNGFALYNIRARKWKMFGDVSQEKATRVLHLTWIDKVICVCTLISSTKFPFTTGIPDEQRAPMLIFYPRSHLDESSILHKQKLDTVPVSMRSFRKFLLVCFDHLLSSLVLYEVAQAQSSASKRISLKLDVMYIVNRPLSNIRKSKMSDVALIPGISWKSDQEWKPHLLLVLRLNGDLSILNLETLDNNFLMTNVFRVWIPKDFCIRNTDPLSDCQKLKDEASIMIEAPLWIYTSKGIESIYLSEETLRPTQDHKDLSTLLEIGNEFLPIGICNSTCVAGLSTITSYNHRMSSSLPLIKVSISKQSLIPNMILTLLTKGKFQPASELARYHQYKHDFQQCMELTLHAGLELDERKAKSCRSNERDNFEPLIKLVMHMLKPFPCYIHAIVGVARKVDERYWQNLFDIVGDPIQIFEDCLLKAEKKMLLTASNLIRIVEKFYGSDVAERRAICVLIKLLEKEHYDIAGAVVQFLVRSGQDSSCVIISDDLKVKTIETREEKITGLNLLYRSILKVSNFLSIPDVMETSERNVLSPPKALPTHRLGRLLYMHALNLLSKVKLRSLHYLGKECRFDVKKFLREDGAPRSLIGAICDIHNKLLENPKLRNELLFALQHDFGESTEWRLVFATVLGNRKLLIECILNNKSLWPRYKDAAVNAVDRAYEGLVKDVEDTICCD